MELTFKRKNNYNSLVTGPSLVTSSSFSLTHPISASPTLSHYCPSASHLIVSVLALSAAKVLYVFELLLDCQLAKKDYL